MTDNKFQTNSLKGTKVDFTYTIRKSQQKLMSFSKFFNFLVLSIKISQHFKQRKNDKESNSRKFLINLYFKVLLFFT